MKIGEDLMEQEEMRRKALQMIRAAIDAVNPTKLVQENMEVKDEKIKIGDKFFQKGEFSEIVILGIGKASTAMARGLEKLDPDDGLVITKKSEKQVTLDSPIEIKEGGHPYPNIHSFKASKELVSKVTRKKDCLFIFLVSGGGSALFTYPVKGISIEEIEKINRLLIDSGADIHEINRVRKHLSKVKGGRFAEICREHGEVISLILSDVVGDDLSVIASGPTYLDNSTFKDSLNILKTYGIWDEVSKGIQKHITDGIKGKIKETPFEIDADNFLIGNNLMALREMKRVAETEGFDPVILTSHNTGEAKEVAKSFIGIAKDVQINSTPIEPPAALIIGGETTVKIQDIDLTYEGGPNREFVLSSAINISDQEKIVVASLDSDGTDGRGKAGAIADTKSIKRTNLDARKLLMDHDTQRFFDEIGDSIELESETNINDITVILVDDPQLDVVKYN